MGNCGQGSSGNRRCGYTGVVDDTTIASEVQAGWDRYRSMHAATDPVVNDPDALTFMQHLWDQVLVLDKKGALNVHEIRVKAKGVHYHFHLSRGKMLDSQLIPLAPSPPTFQSPALGANGVGAGGMPISAPMSIPANIPNDAAAADPRSQAPTPSTTPSGVSFVPAPPAAANGNGAAAASVEANGNGSAATSAGGSAGAGAALPEGQMRWCVKQEGGSWHWHSPIESTEQW